MRARLTLPIVLLLVAAIGCNHRAAIHSGPAPPALAGDAAHPSHTQRWIDTRLYFGLGPVEHPESGVSEAQWRDFLDREVTPRFPAGLSVVDVYGQWRDKHETVPERLRSKMLIIEHPDTAEDRARIAAIRAAWKQRTGDQSVLEVSEPADVSF